MKEERPSKDPSLTRPNQKSVSGLEEMEKRLLDLEFNLKGHETDIERAFERFGEYDDRFVRLEGLFHHESRKLAHQGLATQQSTRGPVRLRQGPTAAEEQGKQLGRPVGAAGEPSRPMLNGHPLDEADPPLPDPKPASCGHEAYPPIPDQPVGAAGRPSAESIFNDDRPRGWQPAVKRQGPVEFEALKTLCGIAQERAAIVVKATNVVDVYNRFLEDLDELREMKKAIEAAVGPVAITGESLSETINRINSASSQMTDPMQKVMDEVKNVQEKNF